MGLLASSGLRISEALDLRIYQYVRETDDPNFGSLFKVETRKGGNIRKEILLPRAGGLAPFVELFEDYMGLVSRIEPRPRSEDHIFPSVRKGGILWKRHLSRSAAYEVVNKTTGKFPHFFRGVAETFYGKVYRGDPWGHARHFGLRRIDSSLDYVGAGEADQKVRGRILRSK